MKKIKLMIRVGVLMALATGCNEKNEIEGSSTPEESGDPVQTEDCMRQKTQFDRLLLQNRQEEVVARAVSWRQRA